MKIVPKNASIKGVILPALITTLVCSAIGLAIIDKNIRPVFVQTVIIYCFKMSGNRDK